VKILNLYAGIGGNRKLWSNEHEITAVEFDPKVAAVYQDLYPNDKVVIGDAHEYLLNNYDQFNFIWSSPPCPSHSRLRKQISMGNGSKAVYPDMKLYEEILLLQHYFRGLWVVENVVPYYDYLIKPTALLGRHPYWSNFEITVVEYSADGIIKNGVTQTLEAKYGFDLSGYNLPDKRKALRNAVNPEMGLHILKEAIFVWHKSHNTESQIVRSHAQ
jgi:DNA (cytosine-5)-methyltransferase 1